MKIRIEGCTAEELAEYSPYLSLGKVYEVRMVNPALARGFDDEGEALSVGLKSCAHLPGFAKWVEVTECCLPSEEDMQLLREGSYTPEELWGGSRPTCPKCINK